MKKLILGLIALIGLTGFAACSGNSSKSECDSCKHKKCAQTKCEDQVFTGILPGADCDGIRYTLKLDYDDDKNFSEGDYDLIENYLEADSTASDGYKSIERIKSEGDFTVLNGEGSNAGKKLLKLVADAEDSDSKAQRELYFIVESDSTLIMTNADYQVAESGLNYTLTRVK